MATTTYEVKTLYSLDDKASKALENIRKQADRTGQAMGGMNRLMTGALGFLGAREAFGLGKRMFVDFNAEVERGKVGLAGIIKMNLGGSFKDAQKSSEELFSQFQQDAKRSIGTTQDFLEMSNAIAVPVMQAGGNLKTLRELTRGAVVASQAMGFRPDVAGLDIQQWLMGTLTNRDRMAKQLAASMGTSIDKVNKLKPGKRLELLKQALTQPAVQDMAKAFENSFLGVTSTLKDNLQLTLGRVGLPLFKAITEEVKKWNAWFEKNPDKIEKFAKDFAKALVDGFNAVKSVANFIVENRELLLGLLKAMLVLKAGSVVGGMVGGVGGIGGILGNMKAFGMALGPLAGLLTTFGFALDGLLDKMNRDLDKRIEAGSVSASLKDTLAMQEGRDKNRRLLAKGVELGLVGKSGALEGDPVQKLLRSGPFLEHLRLKSFEGTAEGRALLIGRARGGKDWQEVATAEAKRMADSLARASGSLDEFSDKTLAAIGIHRKSLPTPDEMAETIRKQNEQMEADAVRRVTMPRTPVNVTIKMDVTANDPDRFVHDVNDLVAEVVSRPTQAGKVLRGGL